MNAPRIIPVAVVLMFLVVVFNTASSYATLLPDRGIFVFPALAYVWIKTPNGFRWALAFYVVGFLLIAMSVFSATTGLSRGPSAGFPVTLPLGVTIVVAGVIQTLRIARRAIASRPPSATEVVDGQGELPR